MEKLYQQDPFLTRFTAQVVSCAADKGGWSVVLDRTAFYRLMEPFIVLGGRTDTPLRS